MTCHATTPYTDPSHSRGRGARRLITALVSMAALALVPASAAFAQQRAGGNGRALDANPQAGSGGGNRLEGQVDYQARNRVITGEVPGGQGFRGEVDEFAPGEFQGQLSNSSLNDFQRRSFNSAPGTPPSFQTNSPTHPRVVIYNDFSSVRPGQVGAGPANGFNAVGGSYSTGQVTGLEVSRDSLRANGGLVAGSAPPPDEALGYVTNPGGQTVELSASPLLGVRRQAIREPNRADNADLSAAPASAESNQAQSEDQDADAVDHRYKAPGQELLDQQSRLHDSSVNPDGPGQPDSNRSGADRRPGAAGPVAPSLALGRQLETRLSGRLRAQPQTMDQQLAQIQSRIFRPLDQRLTEPGTDPYLDILRRMRGEKPKSDSQDDHANDNGDNQANGTNNNASSQNRAADRDLDQDQTGGIQDNAQLPSWAQGLEMPQDQQVNKAEHERANVLNRQGSDQTTANGNPPGSRGETGRAPSRELNQFMDKLTYDMPRLKTLVSERRGRVTQQMKRGEQALGEGKFFEAEDAYRRVLTDDPGNPLARAGMVNAELAAGLIRSASLNLRKLYADHPELIAVRYDPKLLPPKDRLQWLQGELMRMISSDNHSADPGLMMAYLGHQVDSRQLIRYGLAVAQASAPRDALLPVVRRIWLGDKSRDADKTKADTPSAP